MTENKAFTRTYCPKCKAEGLVDAWKPPKGFDPHMRKFYCTECGREYYMVINDEKLRKAYDRQLSRV
jgi:transposase-like protein